MNSTNHLPAMASHAAFSEWIDRNEQLLSSTLLPHPQQQSVCAVFVSRVECGDYRVRLCEGHDDGLMTWREQRHGRARFGRSYAEALAAAWMMRLHQAGYRSEWSARMQDALPVGSLLSVVA
jgi:hypothetical protein